MNSRIRIGLPYLVVLICISFAVSAALGPNMHSNPSFENGTTGWTLRSGAAKLDQNVAKTGKTSVRVINDGNSSSYDFRPGDFPLINGQKYLLSVWYLAAGEGDIAINWRNITATGDTFSYNRNNLSVSHEGQWRLFEVEITAPSDIEAKEFQILFKVNRNTFKGEIWFDDFSVRRIDETPPNPPVSVNAYRDRSSIFIKWGPPKPAQDGDIAEGGFNIYRSESASISSNIEFFKAHVVDLTWEDKDVGHKPYYYLITALDEAGNESEGSSLVFVKGAATFSGTVKNNFGQPLDGAKVEVFGEESVFTDAEGYFCFHTLPEGNYNARVSKPGYRWKDLPVDIETESDVFCNIILIEDGITPPSPLKLEISSDEPGMLLLNWETPSNLGDKTVAGFNVYRAEHFFDSIQNDMLVEHVVGNNPIWADVDILPEKQYWYAVTLVDTAFNESPLSNIITGCATHAPHPNLISPASGMKFYDQPINFKWLSLSNVSTYELQISSNKSFNDPLTIKDINSASYLYKRTINYYEDGHPLSVDIGLPDGQWYWRVRAIFKNGVKSRYSDPNIVTSINTIFSIGLIEPGLVELESIPKGYEPLTITFFQVTPSILNVGQKSLIEFMIRSDKPVQGEVRIVDLAGRRIATLSEGIILPDLHRIYWDGFDDNNNFVRNGLYVVQIILQLEGQRIIATEKVLVMR